MVRQSSATGPVFKLQLAVHINSFEGAYLTDANDTNETEVSQVWIDNHESICGSKTLIVPEL
jgi:hypothetical protein